MPEALKCPECAAPLEQPTHDARSIRCPYCNATVMLDEAPAATNDFGQQIGSLVGQAMEMSQITQLLRAGNKIEAIRIYRKLHNCDLLTAKNAIERMPVGMGSMNVDLRAAQLANTGAKLGIGIAIFVFVFVAIIISVVLHSVHQATRNIPKVVIPKINIPNITIPNIPSATPAQSSFANKVMEFGSEGIGAGQFKDARSVAVDGAGNIYVGEYSGGRVQVFDADGKFQKLWSIGKNEYLQNLVAERDGTVLAVTSETIKCYEGKTGNEFGQAQTTNGDQHEFYNDACVSLTGDIYAVDQTANIVILNHDGQIKKTIPFRDQLDADYTFVKIAVSGTGDIYLLSQNAGIFKFSSEGKYINRFGGGDPDDPATRTQVAFNMAIDGQGRIYLSGNGPSIRVFSPGGTLIDTIGNHEVCFGIAITDKNEILGCFRNNHSVRKFALNDKKK